MLWEHGHGLGFTEDLAEIKILGLDYWTEWGGLEPRLAVDTIDGRRSSTSEWLSDPVNVRGCENKAMDRIIP